MHPSNREMFSLWVRILRREAAPILEPAGSECQHQD